ncbi:hypothetical protein [uncultured Sphingomonas sp.]|uniref:hypothetical protein n=1 Tax=uncultured Sphingomonas sp. TaxID=158754 RepID=UPI0025F787FA|nr:hypothetical protein [uncultured Sphingomonas sp.]
MAGVFSELEEKSAFQEQVTRYFESVPSEISELLECDVVIDHDLVEYAHTAYTQGVDKFSLLLKSKDPDHFKRAGALLHALYTSKIISSVDYGVSSDEVEAGMGPVHVHIGDIQTSLPFKAFYDEYHNELVAFIMAYQYCAAYEPSPRPYDFDYLQTVCVYLKKNANLSVESFFILFKSLMH